MTFLDVTKIHNFLSVLKYVAKIVIFLDIETTLQKSNGQNLICREISVVGVSFPDMIAGISCQTE